MEGPHAERRELLQTCYRAVRSDEAATNPEICSFLLDSLPTPLLPYVTQRQSNFKTKGVLIICKDLFELKSPAATERECRRRLVTEDLKY